MRSDHRAPPEDTTIVTQPFLKKGRRGDAGILCMIPLLAGWLGCMPPEAREGARILAQAMSRDTVRIRVVNQLRYPITYCLGAMDLELSDADRAKLSVLAVQMPIAWDRIRADSTGHVLVTAAAGFQEGPTSPGIFRKTAYPSDTTNPTLRYHPIERLPLPLVVVAPSDACRSDGRTAVPELFPSATEDTVIQRTRIEDVFEFRYPDDGIAFLEDANSVRSDPPEPWECTPSEPCPWPDTAWVWPQRDLNSDCAVSGELLDIDGDGIADGCERAIATAFRPRLSMHKDEKYDRRETYWEVAPKDTSLVRLFYALGYHNDPGAGPAPSSNRHEGDSEFIYAEVERVGDTDDGVESYTWRLKGMCLSAHWGSPQGDATGCYLGSMRTETSAPTPLIFVALRKHANYADLRSCRRLFAFWWSDKCGMDVVNKVTFAGRLGAVDQQKIWTSEIDPVAYPGVEKFWDATMPFCGWQREENAESGRGKCAGSYYGPLAAYFLRDTTNFEGQR